MAFEWLTKIGKFTVEKKEIKRPGNKPYYLTSSTSIGVLHTTEGNSVDAAWKTLNKDFSAPHFITGENRIVQCRPLGAQAAALRTNPPVYPNVDAQVQIEMSCFTKMEKGVPVLWLPPPNVLDPTLALMAWCSKHLGIPLQKPTNWPDDGLDLKGTIWAANNKRRKQAAAGLWPTGKGWWMHLEVPAQQRSWHYDCGALRRTEMFRQAEELLDKV
jgi:hypothetical protein